MLHTRVAVPVHARIAHAHNVRRWGAAGWGHVGHLTRHRLCVLHLLWMMHRRETVRMTLLLVRVMRVECSEAFRFLLVDQSVDFGVTFQIRLDREATTARRFLAHKWSFTGICSSAYGYRYGNGINSREYV